MILRNCRARIRALGSRVAIEAFSMRVAGGTEKTIGSLGQEYLPVSGLVPALRLSLAPDGKSVTYSTAKGTANLWLAEGLDAVTPR